MPCRYCTDTWHPYDIRGALIQAPYPRATTLFPAHQCPSMASTATDNRGRTRAPSAAEVSHAVSPSRTIWNPDERWTMPCPVHIMAHGPWSMASRAVVRILSAARAGRKMPHTKVPKRCTEGREGGEKKRYTQTRRSQQRAPSDYGSANNDRHDG
jgi:hypothetical protein